MLPSDLLPAGSGLVVSTVTMTPQLIGIAAASTSATAACPACGAASDRLDSRYVRTAADLPWQGRRVVLRVTARRFRCRTADCPRRVFCERLPGVAAAHARATGRLAEARFLVGQFGLAGVYQEGLTAAALPDWELRLGLLRDLGTLERLGGLDDEARQRRQLLRLEVGVAGRLQLEGVVREVWPLDDEAALNEAKPVADGKVVIDAERIRAGEWAMVGNLPEQGVALLVLGAAHDLGALLPRGAGYVRVQVTGFPE
jgi:hypothetical protein